MIRTWMQSAHCALHDFSAPDFRMLRIANLGGQESGNEVYLRAEFKHGHDLLGAKRFEGLRHCSAAPIDHL